MDQFNELSRRGFVKAGVGGLGVAALSLPAGNALASPLLTPTTGPSADAAGIRTLRFTAGTNTSVTASPAGDRLIVEVQGGGRGRTHGRAPAVHDR
ncbi:hypothetical protein [Streptomyces sp. H39-C1]|uniref:hypothetical protein n=1 Tax=Streptomyces sp. H39-C1 TaxID=3004355 RepID=UPI0022AF5F58|nr:hypothetical protein [Streptomyces sp. H39-C1]MCZ4095070.1 hypothetical protein [Streptomyces sp. H39-C1]